VAEGDLGRVVLPVGVRDEGGGGVECQSRLDGRESVRQRQVRLQALEQVEQYDADR
jgi:hypothetical protein